MNNNQLSRYGAIAKALPFNFGKVFFVFGSATDAGVQDFASDFPSDSDGVPRVFAGAGALAAAYGYVTSGNNDVIILAGNSTHQLTSMLTVAKSRVHFIGIDYLNGIHRKRGQSTKVSLGITGVSTNIGTFLNTGVRNSFRGIKFINDDTVAQSLYTFVDGGEYTYIEDCEVYKSTQLDATGAAEFVANGDSGLYVNCSIGSTVDAISGAIIRPCVTFSRGLAGSGLVARDVEFRNCDFLRNAGNTANRFVYGAEANAVERLAKFENPTFWGAALSSATPAMAISFGATQTDGSVLVNGASLIKCSKVSTTTGVFVNGGAPTAGTTGIAVQAT